MARGYVCTLYDDPRVAFLHTARMAKTSKAKDKNHLRAWREFRGMTQAQLAEKAGTTGAVISLIESGDRALSPKWLRKLAPALGTRPGFLFEFDPNDVDREYLEAVLDVPTESRSQALAILKTFKTGTAG